MTHQLPLTNGAAHLLRSILSAPEVVKGTANQFAAGLLLTTTLDELPAIPPEEEERRGWVRAEWKTVEVTELQRTVCKDAVRHAADKPLVGPGPALNHLLSAFGLVEAS
jgi:hypothetical protein